MGGEHPPSKMDNRQVMSHVWMRNVMQMNPRSDEPSCRQMNESCHTWTPTTCHTWMSLFTRVTESCHAWITAAASDLLSCEIYIWTSTFWTRNFSFFLIFSFLLSLFVEFRKIMISCKRWQLLLVGTHYIASIESFFKHKKMLIWFTNWIVWKYLRLCSARLV